MKIATLRELYSQVLAQASDEAALAQQVALLQISPQQLEAIKSSHLAKQLAPVRSAA